MKGKIILFYIMTIQLVNSLAVDLQSPFNGMSVKTDSSGNYSFFVSGHFYGSGTNLTGYPINSLLANIDQLNNGNANFMVCLGDLFKDISNDMPFYEKAFFKKLNIPLFNAVGNHDLTGKIYQEAYGVTDFQFIVNGDQHLFFDTEANNGSLDKRQLDMLSSLLLKAENNEIRQVFIYCHRTIWAKHYEALNGLFTDNTQSLLGNNFSADVYPLLQSLSEKVKVTWFSGSIGDAPASFFYHEDEKQRITYIATAIRGFKRDAWLKLHVAKTGAVNYELTSLTGQNLKKLHEYDAEFWKSTSAEQPFNYKLIPYYVQLIILHRAFWYGIGTTLLLIISVLFVSKRVKSRR